jgi:molybdenum cofactor cytidylyltransferase
MIELRQALRLGDAPQVAFVGAGGKSSAMFAFARQFPKSLVTTSTHLSVQQAASANLQIKLTNDEDLSQIDPAVLPDSTVLVGPEQSKDRVSGPSPEVLEALSDFARRHSLPLFVEADGARLRALKAPEPHEPAIPDFVDAVIVVAGLSAVGKPFSETWVHRPERFAELAGLKHGEEISFESLVKVLTSSHGGLKNIPEKTKRIAFLNQADSPELEASGRKYSKTLLGSYDAVWIGSLQKSEALLAVYEPITGIILAAGESKRLGKPKALLDWKGMPFVRRVAETALAASLDPVIVVTGADAEKVEPALNSLKVKIMRNFAWREGQSSSVKAGLSAIPGNIGAALFMVVDQPQLPVSLIEALSAEHSQTLAPIIAPMVDDHRTNPVLFDRRTFPDFNMLEGDIGGRALFSRHRVSWVPWLDSSLAIDVDTPEDYSRLLNQAS